MNLDQAKALAEQLRDVLERDEDAHFDCGLHAVFNSKRKLKKINKEIEKLRDEFDALLAQIVSLAAGEDAP